MRPPIWSCSARGFACHPCYHGRGALLPHLFTLTLARPVHLVGVVAHSYRRAPPLHQSTGRARAVYFLCHYPSSCPARALPGALPYGVRTFLPPTPYRALARHALANLPTPQLEARRRAIV